MDEHPLTVDSLVLVMPRNVEGWNQGATFCRFDNVPQDGVNMGAAEATNNHHHPASNA